MHDRQAIQGGRKDRHADRQAKRQAGQTCRIALGRQEIHAGVYVMI